MGKFYEWLKDGIIKYHDALENVFGKYHLEFGRFGDIFLYSESGIIYSLSLQSIKTNDLYFMYKDNNKLNYFKFYSTDNGIAASEIKINAHNSGINVDFIERVYGDSPYDTKRNTLLELCSTNYAVKNCSKFKDLVNLDFLKQHSMLTTSFSAHMKYFCPTERKEKDFVNIIYSPQVYFNGEDISHIYELVNGDDEISRIYNLYLGNVHQESCDIKAIITGLADRKCFNYKYKNIGEKLKMVIGERIGEDMQKQTVEEYIDNRLEQNNSYVVEDATQFKTPSKVKCFIKK